MLSQQFPRAAIFSRVERVKTLQTVEADIVISRINDARHGSIFVRTPLTKESPRRAVAGAESVRSEKHDMPTIVPPDSTLKIKTGFPHVNGRKVAQKQNTTR